MFTITHLLILPLQNQIPLTLQPRCSLSPCRRCKVILVQINNKRPLCPTSLAFILAKQLRLGDAHEVVGGVPTWHMFSYSLTHSTNEVKQICLVSSTALSKTFLHSHCAAWRHLYLWREASVTVLQEHFLRSLASGVLRFMF